MAYQDDDDQLGSYLADSLSPLAQAGIDPDTARANPQAALAQVAANKGYTVPGSAPAAAAPSAGAAPASVTPTGNASTPSQPTWADYARQGIQGQMANLQKSDQQVSSLASQPDLATSTADIEAQRAKLSQPIDPNQAQYRPGIGTRILRGYEALRRGGILGPLDPTQVGVAAYSAPNSRYGRDTAIQQKQVGSLDQQLSEAAANYKAASDRMKALATEERANATGYKDVTAGAASQETEENRAAAEKEKESADAAAEALRQQEEKQRETYQSGEISARNRENDISAGRLGVEQGRLGLEKQRLQNELSGNNPARDAVVQKATDDVTALENRYTYNSATNKYEDMQGNGQPLSPEEFTSKKQSVVDAANKGLTAKKMPPINVTFNPDDARGAQYKKSKPAAASTDMETQTYQGHTYTRPKGSNQPWSLSKGQ